jgi:hypothetical protein
MTQVGLAENAQPSLVLLPRLYVNLLRCIPVFVFPPEGQLAYGPKGLLSTYDSLEKTVRI